MIYNFNNLLSKGDRIMNLLISALTTLFSPSWSDQGPHQRYFKTEFSGDYRNFVRATGRQPSECESKSFVSQGR